MEMTPNRKNNKHYPPEDYNGVGTGMIKSNSSTGSCYSESHNSHSQSFSRTDHHHQFGRVTPERILESRSPHSHHSQSYNQQKTFRKQSKVNNRADNEFIPLFVLAEASRENSDRKVQEICQKLYVLPREEAEPVVNFKDATGRTALSYGCGCGNISIIDAVSRFKFADPNLPDNDGNAPLHYSSVCGHSEGVDLLLTRFHGVIDVNALNASGITPLMKAGLQGRTRCAKSLLAAGASPFMKDHIRGLTAAEWAKLCGRHMCAEIINRSADDNGGEEEVIKKSNGKNGNGKGGSRSSGSSLVYSRTLPNLQLDVEKSRNSLTSEETPYYHLYARSTVNGAKWLKNKIKKALGGARSGEDRSYVYDNPAVRSLADRRPTLPDRNFSVLTNLGLGGAAICASSLLLPDIQPLVDHQRQRPKVTRKVPIPVVQITPVRR